MIELYCNSRKPKTYKDIYIEFIKENNLKGLEFFVGDCEDNKIVLVETTEILSY